MSEKLIVQFPVPQEVHLGAELVAELSTFTEAKDPTHPENNEDLFGYSDNTFVLADGSTPKKGNARRIDGKSGGSIAAGLVAGTILGCQLNGQELVNEATAVIRNFYAKFNPEALTDAQATFATTFVAARVISGGEEPQLMVTQVGDTAFRINGKDIYTEKRESDTRDAALRAAKIGNLLVAGMPVERAASLGREAIEPSLNEQYKIWNNADHPLGFGYLNGQYVPDRFVHVYSFALSDIQDLELISDGYPKPAEEPSIASWEAAYADVQATDPYRYTVYPATKTVDDRSVAIIGFHQPSSRLVPTES